MDAFGGRPVWLASLSRRDSKGRIIATGDWVWRKSLLNEAIRHLRAALTSVGDESLERLFRMNITLCLHRACSEAEVAALPPSFEAACGGLAGGPVQVLWQRGIPEELQAAKPCHSPGRDAFDPTRPDLWLPIDCGHCAPCLARKEIEREVENASRRSGFSQSQLAR